MSALTRAELRSRVRMLVALGVGVAFLVWVFAWSWKALGAETISSFTGAETGGTASSSDFLSAFAGASSADLLQPLGWMAFAFKHPVVLALVLAVPVSLGTAAVAGEVESGRADLVFVRPRARRAILAAWVRAWAVAQAIVIGLGALGGLLGVLMVDELREADPARLLLGVAQLVPLTCLAMAVALLASVVSRTRAMALGLASGAFAGAYLLEVVSGLLSGGGWIAHLEPFGYFDPIGAVLHGFSVTDAAVLLAATAVVGGLAVVVLERRDLG